MAAPLITFLSDFGTTDWFVGVVRGVLYDVCTHAHVVDLCHSIEPGAIGPAAFMLEAAAPDFPPGTVHLAVVDPGVGTSRRALAIRARGQFFVGPDNGLLEWALSDPAAEARSLVEEKYFRLPMSRTFHGRDVFAPVAAHLACGAPFERFGPVISDPVRLPLVRSTRIEDRLEGRVRYVDRFGNGLTDLTVEVLAAAFPSVAEGTLEVEVAGRSIRGIARSYGDAPIGAAVAIIGSSGRLEIAEVGGHAASRFGFGIGDRVTVRGAPSAAAPASPSQ